MRHSHCTARQSRLVVDYVSAERKKVSLVFECRNDDNGVVQVNR